MARTLVVIRHAKTERSHPDGDHERELTDRGVGDALALGRWLSEEAWEPDLVLVSTAARARQTAEHLLVGAGVEAAQVWPGGGLYDRGVPGALAAVREAPEEAGTVWVVGHEPTMSALVLALADPAASSPDAVAAVREHLATATAAVLRVPADWTELAEGMARLEQVHTARS
jgi:phosphohistidine phosphatase